MSFSHCTVFHFIRTSSKPILHYSMCQPNDKRLFQIFIYSRWQWFRKNLTLYFSRIRKPLMTTSIDISHPASTTVDPGACVSHCSCQYNCTITHQLRTQIQRCNKHKIWRTGLTVKHRQAWNRKILFIISLHYQFQLNETQNILNIFTRTLTKVQNQ